MVERQEQVIGRTKDESVELEDKTADSHVSRTDQERFGKIFRRNMPYGTVTDHGMMFVGFSAEQRRLTAMVESMAGLTDGRSRRTHQVHETRHRCLLLHPVDAEPAPMQWH
jgi:porphyrinogen peroxidase